MIITLIWIPIQSENGEESDVVFRAPTTAQRRQLFQDRINSVQETGPTVTDSAAPVNIVAASPLPKRATRIFGTCRRSRFVHSPFDLIKEEWPSWFSDELVTLLVPSVFTQDESVPNSFIRAADNWLVPNQNRRNLQHWQRVTSYWINDLNNTNQMNGIMNWIMFFFGDVA